MTCGQVTTNNLIRAQDMYSTQIRCVVFSILLTSLNTFITYLLLQLIPRYPDQNIRSPELQLNSTSTT